MREKLKKFLKWVLHDHDDEVQFRNITYRQFLVKEKWEMPGTWITMSWVLKCKTCNRIRVEKFNSSL